MSLVLSTFPRRPPDVGGRVQHLAARQRHRVVVDGGPDQPTLVPGAILQRRAADQRPAHIANAPPALSLTCPGPPTPRSTIWRELRSISPGGFIVQFTRGVRGGAMAGAGAPRTETGPHCGPTGLLMLTRQPPLYVCSLLSTR